MSLDKSAKSLNERAAALLHLRGQGLGKGDPLSLPIESSSVFHLPGDPEGYAGYGRVSNGTWEALEDMLGLLEGAPTLCFPSGMGAISAALFSTLKAGQTLLVPSDGYYMSRRLAEDFLRPLDVKIIERSTPDFEVGGFEGIDVVLMETPSNPRLDICDIAAVADQVRAAGGVSIVDNTTMTPFGQRPLELGADIVVASDTKAPGGHSDVLLGHVATQTPEIYDRLKAWRAASGAIVSPHSAWAVHRGLETLELRFSRMCDTAELVAERLSGAGFDIDVTYPGLTNAPGFALAQKQMDRFGFLIGLTFASEARAEKFINSCPLLRPTTSFGGVHSSAERRKRWGDDVGAGFVRLSVGCEPAQPLLNALLEALETAQKPD